jgi:hypothetical protein
VGLQHRPDEQDQQHQNHCDFEKSAQEINKPTGSIHINRIPSKSERD